MLISETPSKCLIESIRQQSPKRKTLVEFYHEDERIETKYEVASIESEQSSNVTNSESIVLCEEFLCNGSIPIPLYIETPALRTAEIREEVACPQEDVSTNSSPAFPTSYELLDIREGYEIEENNREEKNMTPSPTTRVVIDRLSREMKHSAQSPELLEIRQGYEIEDQKQKQEINSSASSSAIDTFGLQPNSDVSDQMPSVVLSEISNGFKMEHGANKDERISTSSLAEVVAVDGDSEPELENDIYNENVTDLSAKDDVDEGQNSYPTNISNKSLVAITTHRNDTLGYCDVIIPSNALANPITLRKNEALQLHTSKRKCVRPEITGGKIPTTNVIRISKMLSNISQANKNLSKMYNDNSWSQRLYQQALDRSARLEAKRRKSKEDEKFSSSQKSESTTLNKQCAFGSSTIWIPASRRRSKSSKDACFEVSLPKKKQMPSKVSTLQVFERLSKCRKVSCKSSSQRQEPVLSKTRKQDSSQLTTSKACERLYRLGLARQRNRRTPPIKSHDDTQKKKYYPSFFHSNKDNFLSSNMSKETSTTVASIESNCTGEFSELVYDRLYNLSRRNRKKGNVEEERHSRTRSRRRPEGMAQGINDDCSSPVYNRLYEASKAKQDEGKRRRQQIEQTIAERHAIPDWSEWTIPLDQAEDYYHKSLSRALSHERKMVLAAYKMGTKYEPKYSFNSSTLEQYGWR